MTSYVKFGGSVLVPAGTPLARMLEEPDVEAGEAGLFSSIRSLVVAVRLRDMADEEGVVLDIPLAEGLALLCLFVAKGTEGGTSLSPLGTAFQCGTIAAASSVLKRRPLGLLEGLGDVP